MASWTPYSQMIIKIFSCPGFLASSKPWEVQNKKTIKREKIEALVLNALKTHLMRDDRVKIFCAEYTQHFNQLQSQRDASHRGYKSEVTKLNSERANIIQAIKDNLPAE